MSRLCWALAALLILLPALSATADADLWWHLLAGEMMLDQGRLVHEDPWTFTVPGARWVDHEWLPELATAAAWRTAGTPGLLAVRAVVLWGLMAAWLDAVARRVGPAPSGRLRPGVWVAVIALPWPLLSLLANLRPQTLTWALVPAVVSLVDRIEAGRRWAVFALVGLIWFWANAHGGFLFGWGLAGLGLLLAALGVTTTHPSVRQRVEFLVAAAAIAVCPVFTPYGMELVEYVIRELTSAHPDLPEWNPPEGMMRGVLAFFALVPIGLWCAVRCRVRVLAWVGFGVALLGAMAGAKFIALVMLLGAICAARPFTLLLERLPLEEGDLGELLGAPLVLGGAVVAALALQVPLLQGPPGTIPVSDKYPAQAVRYLRASGDSGKLATPLGWGGIALYHLYPDFKVSMDGRNTTVYSVETVDAQSRGWRDGDPSVVTESQPDLALVETGGRMDEALRRLGWVSAFEGQVGTVLSAPGRGLAPVDFEPPAPPHFFP